MLYTFIKFLEVSQIKISYLRPRIDVVTRTWCLTGFKYMQRGLRTYIRNYIQNIPCTTPRGVHSVFADKCIVFKSIWGMTLTAWMWEHISMATDHMYYTRFFFPGPKQHHRYDAHVRVLWLRIRSFVCVAIVAIRQENRGRQCDVIVSTRWHLKVLLLWLPHWHVAKEWRNALRQDGGRGEKADGLHQ